MGDIAGEIVRLRTEIELLTQGLTLQQQSLGLMDEKLDRLLEAATMEPADDEDPPHPGAASDYRTSLGPVGRPARNPQAPECGAGRLTDAAVADVSHCGRRKSVSRQGDGQSPAGTDLASRGGRIRALLSERAPGRFA